MKFTCQPKPSESGGDQNGSHAGRESIIRPVKKKKKSERMSVEDQRRFLAGG